MCQSACKTTGLQKLKRVSARLQDNPGKLSLQPQHKKDGDGSLTGIKEGNKARWTFNLGKALFLFS